MTLPEQGADTNQASEDELRRYHRSSCAKYETLRGIYPNDRRLTGDPCSCGIETIIRTEKLKLLAEVRERVVGTKDLKLSDIYGNDWRNNYGYTEGQVRDAANHLQRKQLESLTKLEAEL